MVQSMDELDSHGVYVSSAALGRMKRLLDAVALAEDLDGSPALARFPEGSHVKAYRLDPEKSLDPVARSDDYAKALTDHQEGRPEALRQVAAALAAEGIRLELRTYPGSSLITGSILVAGTAAALAPLVQPQP